MASDKNSKLRLLLFFLLPYLLIFSGTVVSEQIPGDKIILKRPAENPKLDPRTEDLLNKLPSDSAIAVWVFFTDKGIKTDGEYRKAIQECSHQLSQRSVKRREKRGKKPLFDFTDIPVKKEYVDELRSFGVKVRTVSRWLNAAAVMANESQVQEIEKLSFVRAIEKVVTFYRQEPPLSDERMGKLYEAPKDQVLGYGESYAQLAQIHVPELHYLGYSGKGVLITMLDTGYFIHHQAFQDILNDGRLIATWDFINGDEDVEDGPDGQRNHGTSTWSAAGGFVNDTLIGPAFGADFALAKTEISLNNIEIQIEEFNWVAGAEWADSIGADVISSSLGYNRWDDGTGYTYEDMDGNTTECTKAADWAASKGIVVVNSAGNERNKEWYYIIAPADGDSVIAVGAVDLQGELADFSSAGPTYDGRIKPDVLARGVQTYCALANGGYGGASGTSFSAPLVAGVCALLLEINPDWTPIQVREALWTTASQADHPENLYGYGIANAAKASGLNFLELSLEEFNFEAVLRDTHTLVDTLIISSTGAQPLDWKLVQNPDWATIQPDSGATPCTCTVLFDPSRLALGISQDTIKVAAIAAMDFPRSAELNVIVHAGANIVAFPNPFSDSITVFVDELDPADKVDVSIFTAAGELVCRFPQQDGQQALQEIWDGKNDKGKSVSSGVYLLKVDINGHSEILKVAKVK